MILIVNSEIAKMLTKGRQAPNRGRKKPARIG
jgi:hypothetical protein